MSLLVRLITNIEHRLIYDHEGSLIIPLAMSALA
jgi:hypothetical protein